MTSFKEQAEKLYREIANTISAPVDFSPVYLELLFKEVSEKRVAMIERTLSEVAAQARREAAEIAIPALNSAKSILKAEGLLREDDNEDEANRFFYVSDMCARTSAILGSPAIATSQDTFRRFENRSGVMTDVAELHDGENHPEAVQI